MVNERDRIAAEIRTFILDEVLEHPDDFGSSEDIPLLTGLIDSFGLMTLIGFIEDRYRVTISNDQVVKGNFETTRVLAAFVGTMLDESAEGRPAPEATTA